MSKATGKSKIWKSGLSLALGLAGLLFVAVPGVRADDDNQQKDPPTRVARVSSIDGNVSLQPGGDGDWGEAARNRPVTVGDKIWADKDSRLELQAGEVTFHVGSMTAVSFLNLDANITQLRLAEGSVNFRVREMREGEVFEVDTPNAAFMVKKAGAFRVDVNENGDASRITAIRGEGDVMAAGQCYDIHTGESAEFNGVDADVKYTSAPAHDLDGLDTWANDRDLRDENSDSAKYVSRDMDGYSDLDQHGTWKEEPNYGHVWYPNQDEVSDDWAPYSNGSWNYVGPWGWSWVGAEPWGFAPYHYGRWNYFGGGWGWCPGPYYSSAFYGPAFVGFLGGGFGFGASFGFGFGGGIGWFPLGYGEAFHPWYHAGGGYIRNVNIHNTYIRNVNSINNVHNNYAYANNVHAVTAASRNTFTSGQAVNRGAARVTAASLRGAQVTNSAGLTPNKSSYTGTGKAGVPVARPSSAVQSRSVIARTAPTASDAPVHTLSASTQQQALRNVNNSASASNRSLNANSNVANNRTASGNANVNSRQQALATNRPPSAGANNNSRGAGTFNGNQNRSANGTSNTRNWAAQGTATDRGQAPRGFGQSQNAANSATTRNDRPGWAGSGNANGGNAQQRGFAGQNSNQNRANSQQNYNNGNTNRGYAQQRSYTPPSRSNGGSGYSAPQRSYSAPQQRSAPSYSAPRSTGPSAAPRGNSGGGGGGGASHGGGGGGNGGGGGSHGGGGGSHGHR